MPDRLDRALRRVRPELSWTRVRNAIAAGQVAVDGVIVRDAGQIVGPESSVVFHPDKRRVPHARLDLPKLYEDDEILVIDKPAGLLTVPTSALARHDEDTVLSRAQVYARHLHGRRGYAGVLHRLDRDTSGALAVALTREAHRAGRALFGEHAFERWYLALVQGVPAQSSGTIDAHVSNAYVSGRRRLVNENHRGGRRAVTHYRVREAFGDTALLEIQLDTGRQHQIRLHLEQLGHPLVGEKVYTDEATPSRARRQMLHAWRLAFPHPMSGELIRVEAPLPADMRRAGARLRRA